MDDSKPLLNDTSSSYSAAGNDFQIQKHDVTAEIDVKNKRSGSSSSDEILQVECQTYWYRWYICFVFSLLALLSGIIFSTWGPIDESAEVAFGFGPAEIELLTNWGPIAFLVSMPFFMWCINNKGLRISTLLSAFFVALGTGLRCLPLDVSILRYFMHAGQIFNGFAACVILAAPPYLSNIWFPPHERITATAVTALMANAGTGLSYVAGLVVDVPSNSSQNHTDCIHSHHNGSCVEATHIKEQILTIFYVQFGLAMLTFLSMVIFFPDRPPKPPSISASLPRIDLKGGLLELRHHKQFWVVAIIMALVIGTWNGWTGVMPIILKPLNISQAEASLIGLVTSLIGSFAGMFFGWLTDRLKGRMKMMMIVVLSCAFAVFLYFIVISNRWIKVVPFLPGSVEIWIVCFLLNILINAFQAVGVEKAADSGYPVSEGTSTSIVVWLFNAVTFALLFVLSYFPNPLDANYFVVSCVGVSLCALVFFTKEENRRLELDIQK